MQKLDKHVKIDAETILAKYADYLCDDIKVNGGARVEQDLVGGEAKLVIQDGDNITETTRKAL